MTEHQCSTTPANTCYAASMATEDMETWRANGNVVLKISNSQGVLQDVYVEQNRNFSISGVDRRLNQDIAAEESLDMFTNGLLSPVRLIEGSDVAMVSAENPNVMGETEMQELFTSHPKTFAKKVSEISSPFILNRMIELAEEADATVRQVGLLKARLQEVSPSNVIEVSTTSVKPVSGSAVPRF